MHDTTDAMHDGEGISALDEMLGDLDWGDGSDPLVQVRSHVLAALQPGGGPYGPPLDAILTWGDLAREEAERRADALGIGPQHAAELVRMARDRALFTARSDDLRVWAPGHALALLATRGIAAHVGDLVPLFDVSVMLGTDGLEQILSSAGPTALAPLAHYVRDRSRWALGRARAADALVDLAELQGAPALRSAVIETLTAVVEAAADEPPFVVGSVVGSLVDLEAEEALPQIRRAYELDAVDESVPGPWGAVLTRLGGSPEPGDDLVARSQRRFDESRRAMLAAIGAIRVGQGERKRTQQEADRERRQGQQAPPSRRSGRKKKRR